MTLTNKTIHTKNLRSRGELGLNVYIKHSESISLAKEAKEIKRCSNLSLHTKHIFTPKFISFDKDSNLLSIKRIHGDELFLTIWNPTSLPGKLRGRKFDDLNILSSRIIELGNWLSKYHQSTGLSEGSTEAATWLQDSFIAKLKMTRDNNLLSYSKVNKIENQFLGEIDNLKETNYLIKNNITICQNHGDFIIYNILIDKKNNLYVIDFADTKIASNLDDIARFYSNLWAIAQTNHWRKSIFEQIANDFLCAYGVTTEIIELPYFQTLMAYNFITYLNGRFFMKDRHSFISKLETGQVAKAGLKWIDQIIL